MQTYQSTPDFYKDYISHHGILGMKWGQCNGPPYPLSAGDHSAAEKKAGYKKSIKGGEELGRKKDSKSKVTKVKKKKGMSFKEYSKVSSEPQMSEITKDNYGFLNTHIKDGKRNINIHGDSDFVNEDDLRAAAKEFTKNKTKIEKEALDVIANDNSEYSIYKLFAEPKGISKEKMKNSLEIKSIFVHSGGNVEISIWEKDNVTDDLTAGHTLDIEGYIKDGKIKLDKYYSMNG